MLTATEIDPIILWLVDSVQLELPSNVKKDTYLHRQAKDAKQD